MRRRILLVVPILVAVGLMAAFWGLGVAFAQTPTPTPTNTPTVTPTWPAPTPTATGSPTPVPATPIPGDPLSSTVVWGCWLVQGQAPVCTWGDYFEIWITHGKQVGDGQASAVYAPQEGSTNYGNYVILPPPNTKQVTALCEVAAVVGTGDFGSGSASNNMGIAMAWSSSYMEYWHDADVYSSGSSLILANEGCSVSDSAPLCVKFYNETFEARWRLKDAYSAFPGFTSGEFPEYADRDNLARFAVRTYGSATGHEDNYSRGSVRMACQIVEVERLDGSEYVPGTPTVGDLPTPVPTATVPFTWTDFPWIDYPDYEVAPPQNSDFEFAPGTTTCPVTIPGFGFEWEDMPWVGTVSFGWYAQEFCFQDYSIESELLNVDVDNMIGTFVSLIFVVFLINNWRAQS